MLNSRVSACRVFSTFTKLYNSGNRLVSASLTCAMVLLKDSWDRCRVSPYVRWKHLVAKKCSAAQTLSMGAIGWFRSAFGAMSSWRRAWILSIPSRTKRYLWMSSLSLYFCSGWTREFARILLRSPWWCSWIWRIAAIITVYCCSDYAHERQRCHYQAPKCRFKQVK